MGAQKWVARELFNMVLGLQGLVAHIPSRVGMGEESGALPFLGLL